MTKSNMCISVEFLAGSDLAEIVSEAKEKAEKFGVAYVCFDFNGVKFSISAHADEEEVASLYLSRPFRNYGISS